MKVETYQIQDWEEPETGLVLAENDEWILVHYIPSDYVVDGYKLFKKSFVQQRLHSEHEARVEKVLRLKNVTDEPPEGFAFGTTIELLQWVEDRYGIFEFQEEDEEGLYYGKISYASADTLVIDMILADGTVDTDYDYEYDVDEIRAITFGSDYHLSLRLLWLDQQASAEGPELD
ncbi:hypothetical protein SAMN05421823_11099 [Catalinimonas alkaloidigena]|uniref:Uncharacterized protein n=1 Tax=Catalinimonas alkaloidigena TaxID=1075417 RepID=A0A1G9QA66_9BACT|nr:hypothetical protein [Catalinimonas alkaloidigena]SDM07972.1 hypothetical protein SAMN05421823_11099 [Catalinimonas alkaloidigena]